MKKAGTRPAFAYLGSGLLLLHLILVHLVGRLLRRFLLAVFFLVGLLVHLAAFRLLVHLAGLVLRERGEAGRREHRRDEDCNELLHVIPSLVVCLTLDRPLGAVRCDSRAGL